ncbi:MAG: CRISPR-associated helicase Cas3' [Halanaerobiales bacterium]
MEVIKIEKFIAHTQNDKGEYHLLEDHIIGTADKARKFANKWAMGELAYLSGLVHDLGKYSSGFQYYLKYNSTNVEHAIAGAVYLYENNITKFSHILALLIAGHHAGLHNLSDLKGSIKNKRDKRFVKESIKRFNKSIELKFNDKENTRINIKNQLEVEFFIRMMFSALVDADFLDTEQHFDLNKYSLRIHGNYKLKKLWDVFNKDQQRLERKAKKSTLNRTRKNIYKSVLKKAKSKNSFFSLTVPTGGGKTRTGLAFALKHAVYNNMDRIVVVIPYTNIIEQTAKIYKDILGEENVLEHHTNFDLDEGEGETNKEKLKLASENWDMPIIVTTTVQFFESLFSHKTSKLRKVHNIANSIIIFDEVQTIPPEYLNSIIQVLKQIVKNYNSSIIFSTATQPAFKSRDKFNGINNIIELVPKPKKLYKKLSRVNYNFNYVDSKISYEEVADIMLENNQALSIVNTKRDAKELFSILQKKEIRNIYHLSTYMCAAHRTLVLEEVKEKLDNNENCYLVSTQLIEAGVDIDFPLVLRAMAPLDSIVQAAGRCNREANMDKGRVVVFSPEENNLPQGVYKTATGKAKLFLKEPEKLETPDVFIDYFNTLYSDINLDKKNINNLRKKFNFRDVSYRFKIIPDNTVNVIIENNKIIDGFPVNLNVIRDKEFISREEWRKLQPYIISIYKYKVMELKQKGYLYELLENVYVWTGKYDSKEGIILENYNTEDMIP